MAGFTGRLQVVIGCALLAGVVAAAVTWSGWDGLGPAERQRRADDIAAASKAAQERQARQSTDALSQLLSKEGMDAATRAREVDLWIRGGDPKAPRDATREKAALDAALRPQTSNQYPVSAPSAAVIEAVKAQGFEAKSVTFLGSNGNRCRVSAISTGAKTFGLLLLEDAPDGIVSAGSASDRRTLKRFPVRGGGSILKYDGDGVEAIEKRGSISVQGTECNLNIFLPQADLMKAARMTAVSPP